MPTLLTEIDPRLEVRLRAAARRRRETWLHRRSAYRWAGIVLVAVVFFALRWVTGLSLSAAVPVLVGLIGLAVFWNWRDAHNYPTDLQEAARALEARHPELQLALQTALEQRAEKGQFTFLQRRVIRRALEHAEQHDWELPDPALSRWKNWHFAAMCTAFAALAGGIVMETRSPGRPLRFPQVVPPGITVTPGNAEAERHSIVVITARFGGSLPKDVQLIWQPAEGGKHTDPMAKSLSDPVFAFSLPPLMKDTTYQVSYDGRVSVPCRLTVFDLPALVRADATLTYPEYLGRPPRTIAETRRVSAVEGTDLTYTFSLNKPVRRAVLHEAEGSELELVATNPERTVFRTAFRLEKSRRFTLRLEDQQGRANRAPEEIRVDVVVNQRPQLRWIAPVGDPRVSPIEEVRLQAEVRDDIGLMDYGVGISVGNGEPEYVSLRADPPRPVQAKLEYLLALEPRHLEPGQLVTWFAWADDFGPDGQIRRTLGDLHYGEVRPLDEIFREDESGSGARSSQQAGGGNQQDDEILDIQRQISIALWKLAQETPMEEKRKEQLDTLEQSQRQVRDRLQESNGARRDARQRAAAEKAKEFMDRTLEQLGIAALKSGPRPIHSAWSNAQGAYQELLKMQPKESRVARGNSRSRSGRQRGNQRQINQLEFKQEDSRYETETEAQPMTTPQQREQLQALSKLRELARRQQEVNQRLQELQTALASAKDDDQREQVRRELKRLEEEQRRLLADTDELRDRVDHLPPGTQTEQARNQLEQTREDMRQSGERLERGEVSPALASGTRAAEGLDNVRENFRRESSSQFSEQLREARRQARELGETQKDAEKKLNDLQQPGSRSLDDSQPREEIARTLKEQRTAREQLLNQLRQVAEESETSEPGLHRRLYDLLRQQGQSQTGEQLEAGAEMLRRGFVPQANDAVTQAGRQLQQLQSGVERAAESVLGDETEELRYAQRELDDLTKQLERERPVSENSGQPSQPDKDDSVVAGGGDPGDRQGQGNRTRGDSNSQAPGSATPATTETSDPTQTKSSGNDRSTVAGGAAPGDRRDERNQSRSDSNAQSPGSAPPATTKTAGASATANNGQPGSGAGRTGTRRGPGRRAGGTTNTGMESLIEQLSQQSSEGPEGPRPLTGEGFNDWFERLRTVEELTQLPEARQRLASARERAEAMRREFKRHSREPQWSTVDAAIGAPLAQARVLLRQELARRENPEALQPVDRDPVPDKYAESVRKYYEALGR